MSSSDLPILRPIPRRAFDRDTSPPKTQTPNEPIKRTKSTIALTTSTLFGIYSSTDTDAPALSRNPSVLNIADFDFQKHSSPSSPTILRSPGLLVPSDVAVVRKRRPTMPSGAAPMNKVPNRRAAVLLGALRVLSLFAFGIAYGVVVTHLHNTRRFTVASVMIEVDRYYIQWGLAGVALGSLLPWLDGELAVAAEEGEEERSGGRMAWDPVVRSVGAFVGIAYAIRKLPWQSTLQVSLTLALVNPFLWYLVDRTRAGFWFSAAVGIAGTAVLLQTNPQMIQAPEPVFSAASANASTGGLVAGLVSVESVGVSTWICSVLFCSCVCFGNVGRRLAWLEKRE